MCHKVIMVTKLNINSMLFDPLSFPGNKKRESCGKTCQGDRDDEWMGVSLARQDKPNGRVLVCFGNKIVKGFMAEITLNISTLFNQQYN